MNENAKTQAERKHTKIHTCEVGEGIMFKDEESGDVHQQLRDRDPIWLCKWIAERPKTMFAICASLHLSSVLLTIILVLVDYDVLPIVFNELPLDIRDNRDYLRGLAWDYKYETDMSIVRYGSSSKPVQNERSEAMDILIMIYHMKDESNIMTKENLIRMREVEDTFFYNEEFQSDFCLTDDPVNQTCSSVNSILRYFDGTKAHISPIFYDPEFNNIEGVLYEANNNDKTKEDILVHQGIDAVINDSYIFMSAVKSSIAIGYPLHGYDNTSDRLTQQEEKIYDFLRSNFKKIGDKYFAKGIGDMDFVIGSDIVLELFLEEQVMKDFALVIGSFFFITLFMIFQTRSLWITFCGIGSILTAFAGANLVYNIICNIKYFGIFHVLAVFIILGIGADDIFIFFDTWRQTGFYKYKSLAHRLSDCYRRASLAMLFTSLTTAVAFCVSATSPFLAVYSFGIFSGILVMVNYISVITFFPSAVIIFHVHFEKYKCCCCCPGNNDTGKARVQLNMGLIVKFFAGPYFKLISHKILRWLLLLLYGCIVAVMIYWATQVEVNEEQIEFLDEDTMMGQYLRLRNRKFDRTLEDDGVKIYLIWGLEEQDRRMCHHSDAECYGVTDWDLKFNLNSDTAQNELLNFCKDIQNMEINETDELYIKRNIVTGMPEIECFIKDMDEFYKKSANDSGIPVTSQNAVNIMNSTPEIYHTPLPNSTLESRYFEVSNSFFLFNGFEISNATDSYLSELSHLVGEARTKHSVQTDMDDYIYWYGTELRFAAIVINTTISARGLGYPTGLPIRDKWEDWMNEKVSSLSKPLQGGFQCTPDEGTGFNVWHWLKVSERLVISAVLGIIVGLSVAIPILILATSNVLVGLLASIILMLITTSVLGVIPAGGWKLGILESLNLVLVVGLAVDYVVHLAEGYGRSTADDRLGRTKHMLAEVGVSVISGACTTLGASIFLIPAKILFFSQFGIFIFSTIGFSLLYSLGLFTTVIALVGPQGSTGSLKPLYGKCSNKNSESSHTDDTKEESIEDGNSKTKNHKLNGTAHTKESSHQLQNGIDISELNSSNNWHPENTSASPTSPQPKQISNLHNLNNVSSNSTVFSVHQMHPSLYQQGTSGQNYIYY